MTTRLILLSSISLAVVCAACSPAPAENTEERKVEQQQRERIELQQAIRKESSPDPADNCLLLVWSEQDDPDMNFDRANDFVTGGAISCATGTSPSEFREAIATLRDAAASDDRARILAQVGIPLLYIDAAGQRRELSREETEALYDEIFDARLIALLRKLELQQMTVEKDQGGFFALGSLWLVVDKPGGRPRLVTINRQAMNEALAAAGQ